VRLLVALSIGLACVFIGGFVFGCWWLFELTTHFRLQLAVVMAPTAALLLLIRRSIWSWAFVLFTCAAVWSVAEIAFSPSQPAAGQERLRILTANVLLTNSELEPFLQLVQRVNPDVLVIVEYTPAWDQQRERWSAEFPHSERHPRKHGFGIAVFSKKPLLNVWADSLLGNVDAPQISFDVVLDRQSVSITAVHAVSPLSQFRFFARNEQLAAWAMKLKDGPRYQVVVGDFNSTTWSPYLRQFLRETGLRDSRQGSGLWPTWPQFCWPMMIPIDHAFVSDNVHVHRRWVESDIGSDHFPIVLDISLTPTAK
jgi:endonuclease/exonuclease/phosphatase (EEP) superfamily protein YafD